MRGLGSDAMRCAAAALYIVKHHRGPLDALRSAVDLGGAVGVVAAIVMGLVGGAGGLRFAEKKEAVRSGALPWGLLEECEGIEYLVMHARTLSSVGGFSVGAAHGGFQGGVLAWGAPASSALLAACLVLVVAMLAPWVSLHFS